MPLLYKLETRHTRHEVKHAVLDVRVVKYAEHVPTIIYSVCTVINYVHTAVVHTLENFLGEREKIEKDE